MSQQNTKEDLVTYYLTPIRALLDDPSVTSIFVNRYNNIWCRQAGTLRPTDAKFANDDNLYNAIKIIFHNLGQEVDHLNPIGDARLMDGTRINAVLPPTAHPGPNMVIRKFPKEVFRFDDLVQREALTDEMAKFLTLAMRLDTRSFVSGATGAGKTTVLNAMGLVIPTEKRLGIIEDTAELRIAHPNLVSQEAARRSTNGGAEVTMADLLKNALRQELQALVIGEIRDPKAATALMLALNTGHELVLSTIHANSAEDALSRYMDMLLSNDTRIPYESVRKEVYRHMNLLVHCERGPADLKQRVVQIAELVGGKLRMLFEWDYDTQKFHTRFDKDCPPQLYLSCRKYGIVV